MIQRVNERGRVLVRFEVDLAALGLVCHNPTANSLYVLETDLTSC